MSIIRFTTAQDVFSAFPAARHDIKAYPAEQTTLNFLDELVVSGQLRDAAAYCAYLLPRREAVWWACQCIRHVNGAPTPEETAALEAAEAWVQDPTEETRQTAMSAGMTGDRNCAATWAALAAAWSGGNFFDTDARFAHPPRPATAKSVIGAVMYAAGWQSKAGQEKNLRDFVGLCKGLVEEGGT
jgi:hypothetical protein